MNSVKWTPRILFKKSDGGPSSGVTGYFLIEWKAVFSIAILHFKEGSRESYHSHAFNALTWWLKGRVTERKLGGEEREFSPSFKPKYTPRENCHKVIAHRDTWALTFRGPWVDYWYEFSNGEKIKLTHGRKICQ